MPTPTDAEHTAIASAGNIGLNYRGRRSSLGGVRCPPPGLVVEGAMSPTPSVSAPSARSVVPEEESRQGEE